MRFILEYLAVSFALPVGAFIAAVIVLSLYGPIEWDLLQ
jgi:hypothetical protein